MVLCYTEEITSLLTKWLQSLESLATYLTGSSPSPSPFPTPHSTQANTSDSTTAVVRDDTAADQRHLGEIRTKATFEEIPKAFHGQTYQNLSDVVRRAVSDLATLCAEMEVYTFQSHSSEAAGKNEDRDNTIDAERWKENGLTSEKERELDGGITAAESDRGKDGGRTASEKERELSGSTAKDSERGKEDGLTASQRERESDRTSTATCTESEREKAADVSSSISVNKCGSLVEFVRCYGPLLDSVRLKQLLSSKEWWERRECLAALSEAKESEMCKAGELRASKMTQNDLYDIYMNSCMYALQ